MYFEDLDYKKFLEEIKVLVEDEIEFKRKFMEVNGLKAFNATKEEQI